MVLARVLAMVVVAIFVVVDKCTNFVVAVLSHQISGIVEEAMVVEVGKERVMVVAVVIMIEVQIIIEEVILIEMIEVIIMMVMTVVKEGIAGDMVEEVKEKVQGGTEEEMMIGDGDGKVITINTVT